MQSQLTTHSDYAEHCEQLNQLSRRYYQARLQGNLESAADTAWTMQKITTKLAIATSVSLAMSTVSQES